MGGLFAFGNRQWESAVGVGWQTRGSKGLESEDLAHGVE